MILLRKTAQQRVAWEAARRVYEGEPRSVSNFKAVQGRRRLVYLPRRRPVGLNRQFFHHPRAELALA
jgi:hypothetical protein